MHVGVAKVLDVITRWPRPLCVSFVPDACLDDVLASLQADRAEYFCYELVGANRQRGWFLVSSRHPRGFARHPGTLKTMPKAAMTTGVIHPKDLWALTTVIGKYAENHTPDRLRCSERWADQAAHKIPMGSMPDEKLLDFS